MIQTHTMTVHTLSISRTQGPTPSQESLAAVALRRGRAEAYLPTGLKSSPGASLLFSLTADVSPRLLNSPFLLFSVDALLPGGHFLSPQGSNYHVLSVSISDHLKL